MKLLVRVWSLRHPTDTWEHGSSWLSRWGCLKPPVTSKVVQTEVLGRCRPLSLVSLLVATVPCNLKLGVLVKHLTYSDNDINIYFVSSLSRNFIKQVPVFDSYLVFSLSTDPEDQSLTYQRGDGTLRSHWPVLQDISVSRVVEPTPKGRKIGWHSEFTE